MIYDMPNGISFAEYNASSVIFDNITKEIYDTLDKHCLTIDDVKLVFKEDRIYLKVLDK